MCTRIRHQATGNPRLGCVCLYCNNIRAYLQGEQAERTEQTSHEQVPVPAGLVPETVGQLILLLQQFDPNLPFAIERFKKVDGDTAFGFGVDYISEEHPHWVGLAGGGASPQYVSIHTFAQD